MILAMREAIASGALAPEQSPIASTMLPPDSNEIVFSRRQLCPWAESRGQRPPFLFRELRSAKHTHEDARIKVTDQQLDKACVQAVTRTLRLLDPKITSAALTKHPAIRLLANGKQWKVSTLKTWIREIDERPLDERAGRPPKNTAVENIQPHYEDAGNNISR